MRCSELKETIEKNEPNFLIGSACLSFLSNLTTTCGYIIDDETWISAGRFGYLASSLPATAATLARIKKSPLEFIGQMTQNIGHTMNAMAGLLIEDPDKRDTVRAIGLGLAATSSVLWLVSTCLNKEKEVNKRTISAKLLSATAVCGLAVSAACDASDGAKQIMNALFRGVYLPSNLLWLREGTEQKKEARASADSVVIPDNAIVTDTELGSSSSAIRFDLEQAISVSGLSPARGGIE